MFASLEEAREFFKNDRFATTNGMVIEELGEDYAVTSMTLTEDHRNAVGTVMGGVYFTLADFAFAAAVNQVHNVSVAMDSNITFHQPAKGDHLKATAKVIKTGRRSTYCEVIVEDDTGKRVVTFTGLAAKL